MAEHVLQTTLTEIPEVEAIYLDWETDDGIGRVYVVVAEHDPKVYDALLEAEDRIHQRLHNVDFDVHVRASQGRRPQEAVPMGAPPLWIR